ncbi:ATP-dependent DNA helicase RecQ [Aquirufa sp. KTFRIE-69F]|uniref:ATP-dependent DNA helicase RecQ n=1 Tax=Aquirufa originis TaxID=3096514 RepID=A0ABW6D795_9BACT
MADIQDILQKYWGHSAFRPLQEEIIHSVLDGKDTLALLPTGGGKSICFQVPALALPGICIVITPLIALMQDQVAQLNRRGIPATALFSGLRKRQIDILLDNCIYGNTKFLYVSPERLKTDLFIERAKQMNISLLVIDEAHCISQWGHDFRPPYLEIAAFRALIPSVPCIALTASANEEVKQEIQEKLQFKNAAVFQKSFSRANLSYSVLYEADKEKKLCTMLQRVLGSSIVYVRNRRRTQEISDLLSKAGLSSTFYHAGLPGEVRSARQKDWIEGKIDCIVATNAFGMGIDKPDVRLVVHLDLPDTIEAYYQEAGRAGRDEKKAYAAILYEEKDVLDLTAQWEKSFPTAETIKRTYQAVSNYLQVAEGSGELQSYDFDWMDLCKRFNLPSSQTYFALKTLEAEGLLLLNEAFQNPSKIRFIVTSTELYDFQIRNEKFESFLKGLLRIYGGNLYTQFVSISEADFAHQIKIPPAEVERNLALLEKFELIEYDKQNGLPKLVFLTPRANIENLPIIWAEYLKKKERSKKKIDAMIHYVKHPEACRTLLITSYFGESLKTSCGICDNCLQRKKEASGKNIPEGLEAERKLILTYLKNGPLSVQDLVDCLRPLASAEALRVIQFSLELGKIHYNAAEELAIGSA